MASSSSSSSSSSSPFRLRPQWKYENDVYVNSGEDILNDFSSHLFDAFRRESVKAFSAERLQKGADATSELFKAIEGSKISVIIFSEGFPFSESCMKQFVKIMECQKKYQIVIPVFYKVLPSDVRWQEGSFGQAEKWKDELVEVSNLAGWDSKATRPESKLVQAIVNDIVKKLESIADSMVKELESLFGLLRDRLDSLASSFFYNIKLKDLHCKVIQVHELLENAERHRSYRYWLLCPLFTDLKNLSSEVLVLMDDYQNPDTQPRKFNQAVKEIDQWLLRFLDSVNKLAASHDGKRSLMFQQPVPRTATYACVEDIAGNNPSLNLSSSNSRFKQPVPGAVSATYASVEDNADNNTSLSLSSRNSRFKKAIFKLEIDDDRAQKKALNIVSQFTGINNSLTFGMEGNKMTVKGCNLDTISIGTKLRKLCHAELVFLGSAEMPEEERGEEPNATTNDQLVKAKKASKFLSRMCFSFK